MVKEQVLATLLGQNYYTQEDLRYNAKCGFLFNKEQMEEFLSIKDSLVAESSSKYIHKLPLITFNSEHCFYVNGLYLVNNMKIYLATVLEDYKQNETSLIYRNLDDIMLSRVFSEIEGTLNIENVPTTRKRIKEIFNTAKPMDKNDVIIVNMLNAMSYIIQEEPEFNKENLRKLYNMLSDDCLDEEDKLPPNAYYRNDDVFIGGFKGAPANKIDEMMDSLFAFANDADNRKKYEIFLPHICHYYILYVHPYFDYNGRTARMVSFWLNYLFNIPTPPYFISEAINEFKMEYYKAIKNTRIMNNDLTYFLGFVVESSIKFYLLYRNMEEIKKMLSKNGDLLTSTESMYIKKILIHNPCDFFNYKMFLEYINGKMSKQGALKMLDRLSEYKLLIKSQNRKKENIYKFNEEFIIYKYQQ